MKLPITASKLILAGALIACLSGCFSSGAKSTVVYSPRVHLKNIEALPAVIWHLRIATPQSNDFLDSERVAVRRHDNTLQVYEGVRWSDNAPDMFQAVLYQAFEDSNKISVSGDKQSGANSDVVLYLEIRQFEAMYQDADSTANAVIQVQAKLQNSRDQSIIANRNFKIEVPAEGKKIPNVMAAFETALNQVAGEIFAWTLKAELAEKK